jgi:acyl-ACP thioesterase
MSVYRQELLLRSKDVDMYRRLRTSELFRLLQEASIRHTEELGMGRDKTLDKGILWVLLLQSAEIARMPEYDERIVLKSWPGRTMHLLFPRYYRLETAAGEHLLSASALWSLVDEKTRKVVFPERYGVEIEGIVTGEEIALPSAPRRMDCTRSRPFTVPYSYVDLNGHMNNTRYFDLAEDCIPAAAGGRALRSIRTEYVSEARFGESFTVSWGEENGEYFLQGEGEKPVFRMRMEYSA